MVNFLPIILIIVGLVVVMQIVKGKNILPQNVEAFSPTDEISRFSK